MENLATIEVSVVKKQDLKSKGIMIMDAVTAARMTK
jgi:hypothetical protein